MSENKTIIELIHTVQETNDTAHDDIKEILATGLKVSRIQIDTEVKMINQNLIAIVERMDKQNGRIESLECESKKRKVVVEDFRRLEKTIHSIKKKWGWILAGLVIVIVIISTAVDVFGMKKIMETIINNVP